MEERIVKYEDIEKVNQTLKTIDVKGKQYAEVNQRIKELENEIENLKMKLSIYDSENRKLKHIVMSLPNGLETLQNL